MPYAIAIVVVALIAWDAFRRHLAAKTVLLTDELARGLREEFDAADFKIWKAVRANEEIAKLATKTLREDHGAFRDRALSEIDGLRKEVRETKQVARSTAAQQQTLTGARRRSV